MMLSQHFSLEEMAITQIRGVDNTPPPEAVANLRLVAAALERVRAILRSNPMIISSGYRSAVVNTRVGGSPKSAHMQGLAADFICPSFGTPLTICRMIDSSDIPFDQLIEEETWVHFSVAPALRREILTKNPAGGYWPGIPPA